MAEVRFEIVFRGTAYAGAYEVRDGQLIVHGPAGTQYGLAGADPEAEARFALEEMVRDGLAGR